MQQARIIASAMAAVAPAACPSASAHDREPATPLTFIEIAEMAGVSHRQASRVAVADLDGDWRPDLVLDRGRVFLNRPLDPGLRSAAAAASPLSSGGAGEPGPGSADLPLRFEAVASGLDHPGADGVSIFVDLDGDSIPDAVVARSRGTTSWQRGRGDGTFEPARTIGAAREGTVAAIAAGDVDRNGRIDLLIGRWYRAYGGSLEAFPADLLLNHPGADGLPRFERAGLPEDDASFDEVADAAGRPIYGACIVELLDRAAAPPPQLALLAYGRRANRLYALVPAARFERGAPLPAAPGAASAQVPGVVQGAAVHSWLDRAPELGFDGDEDRSGRYPGWLRERAAVDPRFDRTDEKPFRSHGNTFDIAVGDIDGDGRFDAVLAEITHAWAGPSSDRTRVLLQRDGGFVSPPAWSLDRIPPEESPEARRWNQGDLFVELADLDLDGRLDLALASGDYPDPPPYEERLRLFLQSGSDSDPTATPRWTDVTSGSGVDLPGAAQLALADFDLDGRIDIVCGQSFTRFTPAMIEAAGGEPRLQILLNRTESPGRSLTLLLRGDPSRGVAPLPLGAIVEIEPLTEVDPGTGPPPDSAPPPRASMAAPRMIRQLLGPGGHSGKQSESIIHAGLGRASLARVRVTWPSEPALVSPWLTLPAGRHELRPE